MGDSLRAAEAELAGLDPGSPEAVALARTAAFSSRNVLGLKEGFVLTPPDLTFKDRLTLDLGDLTVRLIYFGRAHSGSDILIEVPEEGLLFTGDLFLDQGWLPLFARMPRLDVPRFIEVLGQVLDGQSRVETVIPGHRDPWSRDKLERCRDYIENLWKEVNAAAEKGLGPEAVRERFPLGEEFAYLKELGHGDAVLERFHMDNITAFMRQLKTSGADLVEQAAAERGIEVALAEFDALRTRDGGSMMIDETEFNALGYRFLQAGDLDAAIAVFKLNVELFPASWNVYDSLGEGFMTAGRKDLAVQYYRKSLELNPANENGKIMLKRLEGD
jgi:glyoxylase-like metal-dependent hydrolase (beta-lactamase superfamily II)